MQVKVTLFKATEEAAILATSLNVAVPERPLVRPIQVRIRPF